MSSSPRLYVAHVVHSGSLSVVLSQAAGAHTLTLSRCLGPILLYPIPLDNLFSDFCAYFSIMLHWNTI